VILQAGFLAHPSEPFFAFSPFVKVSVVRKKKNMTSFFSFLFSSRCCHFEVPREHQAFARKSRPARSSFRSYFIQNGKEKLKQKYKG